MVNQLVLDNIRQQRVQGNNDQTIRTNLLDAGYPWPEIEEAFAALPPTISTSSLPAASPVRPQPKSNNLLKFILVAVLIISLGTGTAIALRLFSSPESPPPIDETDQLPPEDESRQYIYEVTTKVMDHINQGQYYEALSYFHYKKRSPIHDEEILTSLALIKIVYQQDGTVPYNLPMENITLNGETAEVEIELTSNGQPHLLTFAFHFSHWYITDIYFDEQLDYLSMAHSQPVIDERFASTEFTSFLPQYDLVAPDSLQIELQNSGTEPAALVLQTPTPTQNSYLIFIFEPNNPRVDFMINHNQPFNQKHVLTSTSVYGVIYVFKVPNNSVVTDELIDQFTLSDHLLTLPFEVL